MNRSKEQEVKAVKEAESGNFQEAKKILSEAIKVAPHRPSLYNNRAQVHQFQGAFEDALNDLTTAINLCSENYPKTKCQACCQRGLLYRKFEDDDKARQDFEMAAKIGSKFAKSQVSLLLRTSAVFLYIFVVFMSITIGTIHCSSLNLIRMQLFAIRCLEK